MEVGAALLCCVSSTDEENRTINDDTIIAENESKLKLHTILNDQLVKHYSNKVLK